MQSRAEPIDFAVNNKFIVVMEMHISLLEIHLFTESPVYLEQEGNKILLSEDSIRENMNVLDYIFTRAILGQYTLHESIKKDIGYLYNEELQEKPGLFYKKLDNRDYWVGYSYKLWSSGINATWIYNNDKEAIILEITPVYPGYFDESYETSYDEWIKFYKPYLIKEISVETAKDWLFKSRSLLNQIDKNIEEYENRQ